MARLSKRQKNRIEIPFVFSYADYIEIRNRNNDWDNENLKPIKDNIRKYYKYEQNDICVFCKLPFRDDRQIEHFVPKKGKQGMAEYTFYSLNLSLCCKHCNSKKSTNNDMINWNKTPYPRAGMYFKIIHPHFDNYFDHIEIVDNTRYVSKTVKGYNTIKRCKLFDPVILEVLAESTRYQDDPLVEGVMRFRKLQGDFKEVIDRFFDRFFK